MKYLGLILLNLSSAAAGISCAYKLKRRCIIAQEIIEMCSLMEVEFGYSLSDSKQIVKRLAYEPMLSHLDFLRNFDFEKIEIITELNNTDNERLNSLFNNLGKIDSESMIKLISSFKVNMSESLKKYEDYYKTHSRLFVAFGVFGGLMFSLVLI